MLCPVCRHDNFEGEDNCENCGADLRTVDIPGFKPENYETKQVFYNSKDGTRVPMFLV